jgi:Icc protein
VPGNHDVIEPMRTAGLTFAPLDFGGWQIYGLDMHEDDTLAAQLPGDVKASFERWLDGAHGDLVIATHHPLVDVGCPWLDPDRLPGASDLLDGLVARNRVADGVVRAVVFGHAHQEVEARHGGIALYGAPSTCFQFAPRTPSFAIDTRAPGCRWLDLYPGGRIATRVLRADVALAIDLEDRGH